jgi:hypothetical protein
MAKSVAAKKVMGKKLAPEKHEQQTPCWCVDITIPQGLLALVPDNAKDKHCICMACIQAFNLKTQVTNPNSA